MVLELHAVGSEERFQRPAAESARLGEHLNVHSDPLEAICFGLCTHGIGVSTGRVRGTCHGHNLTVTIARRELRKWLRASPEGQAVEKAVGRLLGGA